jgi:flagellar motor switch protein FliN/FliY
VSPVVVPELAPAGPSGVERPLAVLHDVSTNVTVVAGRTEMSLRQVRALQPGDIIPLDRSPDATVDIYVNDVHIARGDVIVLDDSIATRVSEIDPVPETAA